MIFKRILRCLFYAIIKATLAKTFMSDLFYIENDTILNFTSATRDVKQRSLLSCAYLCMTTKGCCAASFTSNFTCRIELSDTFNTSISKSASLGDTSVVRKSDPRTLKETNEEMSTVNGNGSFSNGITLGNSTTQVNYGTTNQQHSHTSELWYDGMSYKSVVSALITSTTEGNISTGIESNTTNSGFMTTHNVSTTDTRSDYFIDYDQINGSETTTSLTDLNSPNTSDVSTTTENCFGFSEYIFQPTKASFTDAQNVCKGLGGKIVEIESADEELCLQDLFALYGESWYWIGGYNYNVDSTYEWWSNPNSPMIFTNWGKNEPTKPSTQLCVYVSFSSQFQWVTTSCISTLPYICEINQ